MKKKTKGKEDEKLLLEETWRQKESLEEEEENPQSQAEQDMEEDIALFHELFPDVKAENVPDSVWARVEKGESLAASYALYHFLEEKKKSHIQKVNAENEKKAAPKIRRDGGENDYFSPEAVKAMSRAEIKKNYHAILNSMEKWN